MQVFTDYSTKDGYSGLGTLPNDLQQITQRLYHQFNATIPKEKRQSLTYHQWYADFPEEIRKSVTSIQNHSFWKTLCKDAKGCGIVPIESMNELYYSVAPPNKRKDMSLYGATGNFDPHVDGIFHFPKVHLYRVLIGLSDGNTNVETKFVNQEKGMFLNKNNYIAFDFDKTKHQVVNHANKTEETSPRIMLKLHYCVFDNTNPDGLYAKTVVKAYEGFEKVTRFFMETGTNPSSLFDFFVGTFCVITNVNAWYFYVFSAALFALVFNHFYPFKKKIRIGIQRLNIGLWGAYVLITVFLWLRFSLTGLR